jgi:methionyl-tRNA formyltransferase
MKIAFIGTVNFSRRMLERLILLKADITGVITRQSSDFNTDFYDLSIICKQYNIPYRYITDVNSEDTIKWIKGLKPDIIFCFGISQILKEKILNIAPMGVVGYHPAKLPQNRGRHPIVWALVLGLKKTASTFFFVDKRVDTGDILDEAEVDIPYEDDAATLYNKITSTALAQMDSFLPKLQSNKFKRTPQDHNQAGYWRKRGIGDGEIDFRMNSRVIYNLVRGLTRPYVGSHVLYRSEKIKVWKAEETDSDFKNYKPGRVLNLENNNITIDCCDKAVIFTDHEFNKLPKIGEVLL